MAIKEVIEQAMARESSDHEKGEVGDAEMVRDGECTIHPCRDHSAHFTSDLSAGYARRLAIRVGHEASQLLKSLSAPSGPHYTQIYLLIRLFWDKYMRKSEMSRHNKNPDY